MPITQIMVFTATPPRRGVDAEIVFVTKAEACWDELDAVTIPNLNTAFGQVNAVEANINTKEVLVNTSATNAASSAANAAISAVTATTKADEASASSASALASKVAIDAKVIPTEATYNYAYLDAASNSLDLENFLNFKF